MSSNRPALPLGMTPRYWRRETSGVLRPAIEAYLAGGPMTGEQIAAMRAYLRQWIAWPAWGGGTVLEVLRESIDCLTDRTSIEWWLDMAETIGIDPL